MIKDGFAVPWSSPAFSSICAVKKSHFFHMTAPTCRPFALAGKKCLQFVGSGFILEQHRSLVHLLSVLAVYQSHKI
jgi:hypothetical protein